MENTVNEFQIYGDTTQLLGPPSHSLSQSMEYLIGFFTYQNFTRRKLFCSKIKPCSRDAHLKCDLQVYARVLNDTKDYFTFHYMYSFKTNKQTNKKGGFGWLSASGMFIYHTMYQKGGISFRDNQLFTN